MRKKATQGPIPFRRAYLRSVIDQVEVDDDGIRIHGRWDVLERLVMSRAAAAGVPSFCMENGAPEEIRTPDPQIRSLVLYPAELRVRAKCGGAACVAIL